MHAYANFDREVGYTQGKLVHLKVWAHLNIGMNFLVGTLIYYMHLERTEKGFLFPTSIPNLS